MAAQQGGGGAGAREPVRYYAMYLAVDSMSIPLEQLAFWNAANQYQASGAACKKGKCGGGGCGSCGWGGLHVTLTEFAGKHDVPLPPGRPDLKKHGSSLGTAAKDIAAFASERRGDKRYRLGESTVTHWKCGSGADQLIKLDLSGNSEDPSGNLTGVCGILAEKGRDLRVDGHTRERLHMSLAPRSVLLPALRAAGVGEDELPSKEEPRKPIPGKIIDVLRTFTWKVQVVRTDDVDATGRRVDKVSEKHNF